jgi:hypothetical protein
MTCKEDIINPGPSVASESSSSVSSAESLLSNMSNLMTNSVSFIHLNIQSIVPKLDFRIDRFSTSDAFSDFTGKSRIEIKQRTECHQWQGSYAVACKENKAKYINDG